MKKINYLNYFAVGLPLAILLFYPIFKETVLFFSILSTILTGLIQTILGIKMLTDEPNNIYLRIYVILVILYFILWYINSSLNYIDIVTYIQMGTPPILAIYLTVIIYKKAKDENPK